MVELSDLLTLLHKAEQPFETMHGRFRIWRHLTRYDAAFRAEAREAGRDLGEAGDTVDLPTETESVIALWRDGRRRARTEELAGPREGSFGVRDGPTWWTWDPKLGTHSNLQDDGLSSTVGTELAVLFEPHQLPSAFRLLPTGTAIRAGIPVITLTATQRQSRGRDCRHFHRLRNELGSGADRYELEIDARRGLILASTAIYQDEPFKKIEAIDMVVDEPLADSLFRFVLPPQSAAQQPSP
jgi:hypothetical protein